MDAFASSSSIAVFGQVGGRGFDQKAHFTFEGWYKIAKVTYLEPHSLELVDMLEKKFAQQARNGEVKK